MRWGIVGTGMIAGVFADNLEHASGAVKQAVASRDAAKSAAFASKHGIVSSHGSYPDLFADPEVDAIYVATPHTAHVDCVIAACQAGKHVLCEKPMAVTAAEAEQMRDAATAAGVVLLEAFMYRCHPQTLRIMELIQSGAIGAVRAVRSCFTFGLGDDYNVRLDKALRGGGLYDVGCYCVNFSRLIAGSEPTTIASSAVIEDSTGVDIHLSASLGFAAGVVASFDCGIRTVGTASAEILGSDGRISIPSPWKPDADSATITLHAKGKPSEDIVIAKGGHIFALEAEHLAAVVSGAGNPAIDLSPEGSIANGHVLDTIWKQIHG
ncbi:MAG: Gfo/Idh/MocA family oxidoreductase [Planctomycetota bacterium]|jgi:predicted dehydrogenase|nr:Gfo/Idh/MocA family oxidoreductase [Planctomycetota bacterium]